MKWHRWSGRSLAELEGVHPDLRRLCDLALTHARLDFTITDGLRTVAEQRRHVANGASKTMRSRHLTGHAVDFAPIVNGKVRWEMCYCRTVAEAFKLASEQLSIPIVSGAIDWGWDGPHIELDRKRYPPP